MVEKSEFVLHYITNSLLSAQTANSVAKVEMSGAFGKQFGRANQHTYTKASVDYTVEKLKANGFNSVEVIAPAWYSRPLVIGKK